MKSAHLEIIDSIFKISNYRDLYSHNKRHYGYGESFYEAEVHVLEEIVKKNDITILELVNIFYKTKGYMSQIISSLVQKKLVKKEKSKIDSRKNVYKVTEKGMKLHTMHLEYDEQQAGRLRQTLQGYRDEDIRMILDFLEKYHRFQLENKEAITNYPLHKK